MLKNAQHERFANEIAKGRDNTSAYQAAYPKSSRVAARKGGSRLLTNEDIQGRIVDLQRKTEDKTTLSIMEKRQFYALIVRTPIGEIDDNHPLCQAVKRTETKDGGSVEFKMPDKLRATELDNELSGHVKQVGTTVNVGVAVNNITATEEQRTELISRKRAAAERAKLGIG